ncbi:MAG: CRISPR-associated endonuclease Cas2 [Melioribacteraceae bacterium]|nr:CRISPR-associated endonuclease Cas2 [Melioribacteraceae bacterium]
MVKKTMFYIVTYDIKEPKRLPRALKICRKYLFWVQKSVFEGELTAVQFRDFSAEIKSIINKNEDAVLVYSIRMPELLKKNTIGLEKNQISFFI